MMSRMESMRAGNIEDGESINDVDKLFKEHADVLGTVNIATGNLGDAIQTLGEHWDELDPKTQKQFESAVAGVRQVNQMDALMSHFSQTLSYQSAQLDDTGLATQRFNVILGDTETAATRSKSAWQDMWAATINSGAIEWFYNASTAVAEFIKNIGGLAPVVGLLVSAFVALKSASIVGSITDLIGMFKSLSTSVQSSIATINNSLMQHAATATETADVISTTTGEEISSFEDLQISVVSGLTTVDDALATTATTAKVTAAGVVGALGTVFIAISSIIAVYQTYQSQIVATQQVGMQANTDAWTNVFDKVNQDGPTSVKVLQSFSDGIKSIRDNVDGLNPIEKLFVDQQGMVNQGLESAIGELKSTSSSWDDYIANVKQAAEAAGYQVDAQGRVYTSIANGHGAIKDYDDALNTLIGTQDTYKNGATDLTKTSKMVLLLQRKLKPMLIKV